jgi:pimeloyl-ACP methyl ester carboxylesterase
MSDGPMSPEQSLARRTILKGASLGVGAGLASALTAQAQSTGAGEGSDGPIWSGEYWAKKGEVALNLRRKRVGAPKTGETPLPILFLVHGSSNSARSSYDLTVPGRGEYSLMNVFARYGYDVWTMDHDGYGHSGSSGNNSDIASSVEDLKAAIPVVARETGQAKMHFYGTSSGAIRAAAFAQAEPERVERLVLVAFTYKGTGASEIGRREQQIEFYRSHNRRKRDAAMIRSIFTRDGYSSGYDMAVPEAIIAAELKFGEEIPSGTYLDMAANLPLVDPKRYWRRCSWSAASMTATRPPRIFSISSNSCQMAIASSSSCRTPRIAQDGARIGTSCGTRRAIFSPRLHPSQAVSPSRTPEPKSPGDARGSSRQLDRSRSWSPHRLRRLCPNPSRPTKVGLH